MNLPSNEEIDIIAVSIAENTQPELSVNEQAMFIAGFQEAFKYLKNLNLQF